jgi:hypothetical protein
MALTTALQAILATRARQAAAWTGLGILGLVLAGVGMWLTVDDDNPTPVRADPAASTTATPSPSPSRSLTMTPTPSATPSPTATPGATEQPAPRSQVSSPATVEPVSNPTEEPAPEPTPEPAGAGAPYCPAISQTATPTRVLGTLTIGDSPAPAGTTVTLAFDGVAGPSESVTVANGVAGFSIDFTAAQGECANRVGAAIGAYVNGGYVASGQTVGGAAGQAGFIRFDISLP